jgi:Fe-S-cluster-containing hydrogenase component 2
MTVEPGGVRVPVFCTQCRLCISACPAEAIKIGKGNAVVVDLERCNGCGVCVVTCPFGAVFLDPKSNKAVLCDLCGGNPACVKYCPPAALRYEDANLVASLRRKDEARGLSMTFLYRKLWRYREKKEEGGV